jgi:hypothetical protein
MRNRHQKPLKISSGAQARLEQQAEARGKSTNDIIEELIMEHLPPVNYTLDIKKGVLGGSSKITNG